VKLVTSGHERIDAETKAADKDSGKLCYSGAFQA